MSRTALIVCNGELRKGLVLKLTEIPSVKIISCDGASNFLFRYKITPQFIIGDMDGISAKALAYYKRKKVTIKKITEQEHTDFEKALKFAVSSKFKRILVIGYGGKRIDHTLTNFSVLKRYSNKAKISFFDSIFEIFFTSKPVKFDYKKTELISFLGMPKAMKIKTKGLAYSLNNENLVFGVRESISNRSAEKMVEIDFNDGSLLVFRKHFNKFIE